MRTWGSRAFTLIEFIGVLAVIAILATVLVPVVIKRVDIAAYNAEQANLANIANALTLQVLHNYQIPSQANWSSAVANWLAYPAANVATNARGYSRAFVYDQGVFSGSLSLPYIQSNGLPNGGSLSSSNNLRLMIVTSLSTNLSLNTSDFNAIWNTSQGNVPSTGSGWGSGQALLIQRVNLLPLFHRVILNAEDTNNFGRYVVQSGATSSGFIPVFTNNPADAWYLQGTVIGLYDAYTNLQSKIVVQADASYVFENTTWRGQLSGWGTNGPASPTATPPSAGDAFISLATKFTARGYQDQTPVILAGFYAFMVDYNAWSQTGFATTGPPTNILNALSQDAVRIQNLPSW